MIMKLKHRMTALLMLLLIMFLMYRGKKKNFNETIHFKRQVADLDIDLDNAAGDIESLKSVAKVTDTWSSMHPWDVWVEMVSERKITGKEEFVGKILKMMVSAKIIKATTGYRGTQLKAMFALDGPQQQLVVFKPKRYSRDKVLTGTPYEGYDRHNAEIAAFHLDRILGFFRAPPAVGRFVDLEKEVKPVSKKELLSTIFTDKNGNTCFFGKCKYCNRNEPACAEGYRMEGAITIWLPPDWPVAKLRHPWQRTYNNKKARWEINSNYCKSVVDKSPYDHGPRFLDIIDASIFDFLIGNADRHHYEYLETGGNAGMLLHMDNGKSFGNPYKDELSILSPLMQCCKLRHLTHQRLEKILKGNTLLSELLDERLQSDELYPILTIDHLKAIDRRLKTVMEKIDACRQDNNNVIIFDGL